ncbi:hypothetical protein MHBO_003677 [Bonamia ostreae]|uniref:Cold shock domain-containing protein n=1 Tax=Bonamia ostreae TaxID=126728 RepID=A0ABV2AR55_9EUKA
MSEKSDEENLTWTEDLNPENYFDWTISKSLQEKKENVNTPQNTNEEVFNSQTNLLSSKGTVVYFDLKTDEGCLREDKNVRNFFFSSKDIFSNDFLVYKGEEVLFNYNNENVENKRPEAFNIVCKSLKRRIMVGEVVFSSHERGFGWISIAIFDKNKPFVFFMEKNVLKKKDGERIEKGDRVRFIVNLEFEQPFASRLELV